MKEYKIDEWSHAWEFTIRKVSSFKKNSDCIHDNCSSCDGTGIRKDGLGPCIHMMSCSCPKCSPKM
jgi:hypothetical protein